MIAANPALQLHAQAKSRQSPENGHYPLEGRASSEGFRRINPLFDLLSWALCSALWLSGLSVFTGCGGSAQTEKQALAVQGVLDLTQWDFEKDGAVALSGEYEFYWMQLLPPESFSQAQPPQISGYLPVPAAWNDCTLDGKHIPGIGYATYRLTIFLSDAISRELALKFLDMGTSCAVFVNGNRIVSMGEPGTSAATTTPGYMPQVVDFTPDSNRLELVYQVSNFYHHRGGAWELIYLGTEEQLDQIRERRLALDLILFGSILALGLYRLALFVLRRSERSELLFGIFCLIVAVRLLTTVERYLLHLLPTLSWEALLKVEYLTYYSAIPVFALLLYSLFPQDTHKIVVRLVLAVGIPLSGMVAFTPARVFTQTLFPYQIFTLACLVYALLILALGALRHRKGAATILVGVLFLTATVLNDILDANGVLQTGHYVHLGLFFFLFCHAFMLSARYSSAFVTIALQRSELEKSNLQLQQEAVERRQAEEAQRHSEERFRQLAENIREVFWLSSPEKNQIIYISPGYEAIWGRTCESIYASPRNWVEAIHHEDRERVLQAAMTKQISGEYDEIYRILQPNGEIRWIRDRAFPVRDQQGVIYRVAGIAEDITVHKQAEQELQRSQEELRRLSAHLEYSREEERTRIAREIHDELGQVLSTLKMDLGTLENQLPRDRQELFALTKAMSELIYLTMQRVRRISQDLRPSVLDHLTFAQAVSWQVNDFMNTMGIVSEFRMHNAKDLQLPAPVASALFRVLQEALTNVIRHAKATQVAVVLEKTDTHVLLQIHDNGQGMPTPAPNAPQSFGLLGMRERLHHLHGSISINSVAGRGTTIACTIPLSQIQQKKI